MGGYYTRRNLPACPGVAIGEITTVNMLSNLNRHCTTWINLGWHLIFFSMTTLTRCTRTGLCQQFESRCREISMSFWWRHPDDKKYTESHNASEWSRNISNLSANSSNSIVTYMGQKTRPYLHQIMDCRLHDASPLSESLLVHNVYYNWRNCMWKFRLQNDGYFVSSSMC